MAERRTITIDKIIWTKAELEEYVNAELDVAKELRIPYCGVGPFAFIRIETSKETRISEVVKTSGVLDIVYFYFPPGHAGLVELSALLGRRLIAGPVVGDNQYIRLLIADKAKAGDTVSVVARNFDKEWTHTPGIRLELMPDSV